MNLRLPLYYWHMWRRYRWQKARIFWNNRSDMALNEAIRCAIKTQHHFDKAQKLRGRQ